MEGYYSEAEKVAIRIMKSNPGVVLMGYDNHREPFLMISKKVSQIKVPDEFDYNPKNGITNKHRAAMYISIPVMKW